MDDALMVLLVGGASAFVICVAAMIIRRWPK